MYKACTFASRRKHVQRFTVPLFSATVNDGFGFVILAIHLRAFVQIVVVAVHVGGVRIGLVHLLLPVGVVAG